MLLSPKILVLVASSLLCAFAQNGKGDKDSDPPEKVKNRLGTYLDGFDGCDKVQKAQINEAHADFRKISNTDGVKNKINFNSGAACEYLGPPGFNEDQQTQIQAVFANAATVYPGSIFNPFQHAIRARCDDPMKRCPCGTGTLIAYSRNQDADNPNKLMINFCLRFFEKRSLEEAIRHGSNSPRTTKFDISSYDNRCAYFLITAVYMTKSDVCVAATMFHELLHLDLVADSGADGPNPPILDLTIQYKSQNSDKGKDEIDHNVAYGPMRAKLLARYEPYYPDEHNTAENLVMFALATYLIGPPWHDPGGGVAYSVAENGDLRLETSLLEPAPQCEERTDGVQAKSIIEISALHPDSAYSKEYDSRSSMPREIRWITSAIEMNERANDVIIVAKDYKITDRGDRFYLDMTFKDTCTGSTAISLGENANEKRAYCKAR
ncbi:hypothetical protein AJ80_07647 [Polytolypa hystricis UAMH7299]|uniref:Lysine-specific metallo-endopeptidase domain-containing protein n=1 Tax=Polytolypa hystricis (strain UAMH7299) TaxID=1447883 RepID=A0A2B7XKL0_POLH7|nr:hypothetical protein AJ80_07647 [Polytolypa hystricis UAMH7299]